MSFPKISRRAHGRSTNGRLASQFVKRLAKGLLIDRTAQAVGMKDPKVVKVPEALDDQPSQEWWKNEMLDRKGRKE